MGFGFFLLVPFNQKGYPKKKTSPMLGWGTMECVSFREASKWASVFLLVPFNQEAPRAPPLPSSPQWKPTAL